MVMDDELLGNHRGRSKKPSEVVQDVQEGLNNSNASNNPPRRNSRLGWTLGVPLALVAVGGAYMVTKDFHGIDSIEYLRKGEAIKFSIPIRSARFVLEDGDLAVTYRDESSRTRALVEGDVNVDLSFTNYLTDMVQDNEVTTTCEGSDEQVCPVQTPARATLPDCTKNTIDRIRIQSGDNKIVSEIVENDGQRGTGSFSKRVLDNVISELRDVHGEYFNGTVTIEGDLSYVVENGEVVTPDRYANTVLDQTYRNCEVDNIDVEFDLAENNTTATPMATPIPYRTFLDEDCGPNGTDLVIPEGDGQYTVVFNQGSDYEVILNNKNSAYVAGLLMDTVANVSKYQRDNVDSEVGLLAQRDHREDTTDLAAKVFSDEETLNEYRPHNVAIASTHMGTLGSIGTLMSYAYSTENTYKQRAEIYDEGADRFVNDDGVFGGLWSIISQQGFTRNGSMFDSPRDDAQRMLKTQYNASNSAFRDGTNEEEVRNTIVGVRDNVLEFTNRDALEWDQRGR